MAMNYLAHLAEIRKKRGFTQASLAERLGVEQPTVQRWEKGKREPSLGQLVELATVLRVEPSALLGSMTAAPLGPRLFVKGEVAAGVWREALELPHDDWLEFTGRADVIAAPEHRFGLKVIGDSMDLVYPPGTIVECVSTFAGADPEPGKRVVVVRTNYEGQIEATVKELVESDGELWLVPRSRNPAHTPICISENDPEIREVRIAAIVVASVRPE